MKASFTKLARCLLKRNRCRLFSTSATWSSNVQPASTLKVNTLSFGQPTILSHPECFTVDSEVIPGITRNELGERRQKALKVAQHIASQSMKDTSDLHHVIIVHSSGKRYMTENIPYPFRQNSNFLYLSGSYDPDSFIVLVKTPLEERHILFVGDPDPVGELWDGPKTSPTAATKHFGFDEGYLVSEFPKFVKELFASKKPIVVWCENKEFVMKGMKDLFTTDDRYVENNKHIFDNLRIIKSEAEIRLMEKSCQIAAEAFQHTFSFCGQNFASTGTPVTEHQIWAKLDYECRLRGAERLAYPPVVAAGARANVIHYVFNSNKCQKDDMILVDAGCEYFGYCSDITRTWPVSGKFSNDLQRSMYQMVLEVQCELIKLVGPKISLDQLFKEMGVKLLRGLQQLGCIDVSSDMMAMNPQEIALRFCNHHVSHYLGCDVHDCPSIDRNEPLVPGMVITVEPGCYIRASSNQKDFLTKVGREFDGIGIRIEDDLVVTANGNRVLTEACPKTISDIEYWSQKKV